PGHPVEIVRQLPHLAPRPPDSNKGMFGRILVVAGSRGMSGAAILCASAALRRGAGLVRAATAAEVLPIVAPRTPRYITAPLPQHEPGPHAARARAGSLDIA